MTELVSIVRRNLMNCPGYTPYCGADPCKLRWPRTWFNGTQFQCGCGWRSSFEAAFIEQYSKRLDAAEQSSGEHRD
jgi:hypothetical protein